MKVLITTLLLSITALSYGDYTTEVPSLMCGPKDLKRILHQYDVTHVKYTERAGHVFYYNVTLDKATKADEKKIQDIVQKQCNTLNNKK